MNVGLPLRTVRGGKSICSCFVIVATGRLEAMSSGVSVLRISSRPSRAVSSTSEPGMPPVARTSALFWKATR